jgi:cytochrome c oxidase cbb3-type subunit 1
MPPRVLGKEWPSALLIKIHWWASVLGITLMVFALQIGGWIQGMEMNNASIPFLSIVKHQIPYLHARSLSGIMLTVAHVVFAWHIIWMLTYKPKEKKETPTMLIG